jgi:hypothetical protein
MSYRSPPISNTTPKPEQPCGEIGVIATLKLEDNDCAKEEEIEKEQCDGKEGWQELQLLERILRRLLLR